MNKERIQYLKDQCEVVQSYAEPFREELKQQLLDAWETFHTVEEIAEAFDYQPSTVRRYLSQNGIDWKSRPHDPETVVPIVDTELKLNLGY